MEGGRGEGSHVVDDSFVLSASLYFEGLDEEEEEKEKEEKNKGVQRKNRHQQSNWI